MTADRNDSEQSEGQGLTEHLAELRTRIIYSLYGLIVTTALAYNFSEQLFNIVRHPIAKYLPSGGLVYTGPMDKFMAHIKIAIVFGIITSCPFWLYQLWKFIAPGLYRNEKKYAALFISAGSFLFLGGVVFSYLVALPMAFDFLFTFGGDVDKPMITIEQYLGFFNQFCLMFGLAFELPLIMSILGMMGLISQRFLIDKGRYAVMILAVVAAVITPPDVMSMIIMLVPLIALYYVGVLVVGLIEKGRKQAAVNERE